MGWSWYGTGGWPLFPFIGMFLFACVMAIAALILVFVIRRGSSGPGGWRYSSPIDELNARYAAGEISRNEYLGRKSSIPKRPLRPQSEILQ
jgi:uncharacterized membrane protein